MFKRQPEFRLPFLYFKYMVNLLRIGNYLFILTNNILFSAGVIETDYNG